MMKAFKTPKLSPAAQKRKDRCNRLVKASKGSTEACRALEKEFKMRVYTEDEIKAFVKENPKITKKVVGKSAWNTAKPLYSV